MNVSDKVAEYLKMPLMLKDLEPLAVQLGIDKESMTVSDNIILRNIKSAMLGDLKSCEWLYNNLDQCQKNLLKANIDLTKARTKALVSTDSSNVNQNQHITVNINGTT